MKGIICYYSGSGNTKLACNYIKHKINSVDFELYDIVGKKVPDFDEFDVAGFATFCDYLDAPQYMHTFFDQVPQQHGKYAFVFNTYGSFSVRTLRTLKNTADAKGFDVLIGYSLHMPENYPPLRSKNRTFDQSPGQSEMEKLDSFISKLDMMLAEIEAGKQPEKQAVRVGVLGRIMPKLSRKASKKSMGHQKVDESLCTECGLCKDKCPYGAIMLDTKPVFDHDKCYGCWACYNHCPTKAIYTAKLKSVGHYAKPHKMVREKLSDK